MEYLLNLISNMAKENKIWLKEDRKVENFEKVQDNFSSRNPNRRHFVNKNFKRGRKFNKKFRYRAKGKRNNFENKKSASY